MDLTALIEAVEKGERGDGLNTAAVFEDYQMSMDAVDAFDGSLDAAKALHDALLPGYGWHCGAYGARVWEYAGDEWHPERRQDVEMPDNPARAFLLAILRARQAMDGGE